MKSHVCKTAFYAGLVAPLVGAWIEMSFGQGVSGYNESLPSWERGLKSTSCKRCDCQCRSLPSWERGLKSRSNGSICLTDTVAPLVGAWIEILYPSEMHSSSGSLPSWERGLKFNMTEQVFRILVVAPLVGAWIEIPRI